MKVKTTELIGQSLDYAVALALWGREAPENLLGVEVSGFGHRKIKWEPSTRWDQGGLIIERERINIYSSYVAAFTESGVETVLDRGWAAHIAPMNYWQTPRDKGLGPTPLIAAMRAFVASRLGEEVEIPEELVP